MRIEPSQTDLSIERLSDADPAARALPEAATAGEGLGQDASDARTVASLSLDQTFEVPDLTTYTVKKDETLYGLAKRFGTTVAQLRAINGFSEQHVLREGDVIKVPVPQPAPSAEVARPAVSQSAQPAADPGLTDYRVQAKETLYGLAQRFGTTVARLRAINGFSDSYQIQEREVIRVPASPSAQAVAAPAQAAPARTAASSPTTAGGQGTAAVSRAAAPPPPADRSQTLTETTFTLPEDLPLAGVADAIRRHLAGHAATQGYELAEDLLVLANRMSDTQQGSTFRRGTTLTVPLVRTDAADRAEATARQRQAYNEAWVTALAGDMAVFDQTPSDRQLAAYIRSVNSQAGALFGQALTPAERRQLGPGASDDDRVGAMVHIFKAMAAKRQVPVALLLAKVGQESTFKPGSVSSSGAVGYSQVKPDAVTATGLEDDCARWLRQQTLKEAVALAGDVLGDQAGALPDLLKDLAANPSSDTRQACLDHLADHHGDGADALREAIASLSQAPSNRLSASELKLATPNLNLGAAYIHYLANSRETTRFTVNGAPGGWLLTLAAYKEGGSGMRQVDGERLAGPDLTQLNPSALAYVQGLVNRARAMSGM